MLEFPRWKYFVILLVLALSVLYALPNIYQKDPSVQVTANRGVSLDESLRSRVAFSLEQQKIDAKSVALEGTSLMVRLADMDAQTRAADLLRDELDDGYTVALNLASTVPTWLEKLGARPMVLGLDLQGGVHFVLQVDQAAALDKRMDAYAEEVRVLLRDNRIGYQSVERRRDNSIVATLNPSVTTEQVRKAQSLLITAQPALLQEVADKRLTLRVPDSELSTIAATAIEQNITTLRNRVNELGVAEPIIQRQGSDRVVVQLPGVQDTAAAKRMIGATATLEYRAVYDGDAADALASGRIPPEAKVYYRRDSGQPVLLNKRVIATGDQMVGAQSSLDQNGQPAVSVTLNAAGG